MSTVDWSKAPEGATHYQPKRLDVGEPDMWCAVYWRLEGGVGVEAWQVDDETGDLTLYSRPTWMKETEDLLIKRPWAGEGLPPVGADVEVRYAIEQFSVWHKATCAAIGQSPEGEQICVTRSETGVVAVYRTGAHIRPARTPEQIAAEERKTGIKQLIEDLKKVNGCGFTSHAEDLYDMGYRKQVMP